MQVQHAFGEAETRFFYELTPERILSAVEAFGFRCTGRCLPLNSMENRVYEVEIECEEHPKNPSERFRIVKFYRPGRWSKEQILEEHQFLLDLIEYEIPVVAPLTFENGQTLLEVPEAKIWCAVFPKVGGRSPDELSDEQIPLVGRLLARLHGVGKTRLTEHRIELSPQTYGVQNLDFLKQSRSLPAHLEDRYFSAAERILDLCEPWFSGVSYHRIHGDCHLGNLLWGSDGPFWVDFDDMVFGPAIQDLWLILPGRDSYAKQKLNLLLEAYEQMGSFDRSTLRLIEPLRALRMIHYTSWIQKRWGDPAFQRTFVEFGSDRYWSEQIQQLEEQHQIILENQYGWDPQY